MIRYEVRAFTGGVPDRILAQLKHEFTDQFCAEGYLKVSGPASVIASYGLTHRTECALFRDGIEVDNSRAFLVETTGNESQGQDAPGTGFEVTWGGQTFWSRFKKVVVYPAGWPTGQGTGHNFSNVTPGFLLKALFDAAAARGAIPWLDYSAVSATVDANGAAWAKTVTLKFDSGTSYQSVFEALNRMGVLDWRMVGRKIYLYNGETYGVDWTVNANPIVLRRGKDVTDTPYSESSADIANVLLVMGDSGTYIEKTDADSIAAVGREESSLSQGGTKNVDTLNIYGDASLARTSGVRGQYTVKVEATASPAPFAEYGTGDYVWLDRAGALTRYRVRQLALTSDGENSSVVVTLNDKFAELDLLNAKKIDGIIGAASADSVQPALPPQEEDTSIPKPPTGVAVSTASYTDSLSGQVRASGITLWTNPTQNTDNSALLDLSGFDVEEQIAQTVTYDPSATWYPGREDSSLQSRWDRRGKNSSDNWAGADGGSSVRAAGGEDWFFWADTLWGTVASDGTTSWKAMPRNSITRSDPSVPDDVRGVFGQRNLLPGNTSLSIDTAGWTKVTVNLSVSTTWAGGFTGRSLKATTTATTLSSAFQDVPITAGASYRFYVEFDPASTVPKAALQTYIRWLTSTGVSISTTPVVVPDSTTGVSDFLAVAPANAASARFVVAGTATSVGQWFAFSRPGLFQTDHRVATWSPRLSNEAWANEITNPIGASVVGASETRRNFLIDPAFASGTTGVSATGASFYRDESDVYGEAARPTLPVVTNAAALAPWHASLAVAGSQTVGIGVIGDSTSESSGGTSIETLDGRYLERLQALLRAEGAIAGVPLSPAGYNGASAYVPAFYVHPGPKDWTYTTSDATAYPLVAGQVSGGAAPGGRFRLIQSGHKASFTARFTSMRLMYGVGGWNGKCRVTIDGVEQTIIDSGGSTGYNFWTSPTFASGDHTVVLEYIARPGSIFFMPYGVDLWDGDEAKGVRVYDLSSSGKPAYSTGDGQVKEAIASRPLSLLSIMLGFNDLPTRTKAQFKADIVRIIAAARTNGYSGPVLLVGQWQCNNGVNNALQADYRAALLEIANADSTVAAIDLSTVMPESTTNAVYYFDGIHPSLRGHARIAEILYGILGSRIKRPAAINATTTGGAANQGIALNPGFTVTGWPVGTTYTVGCWVKAPSGASMQLVVAPTGNAGTTTAFTGTGAWQWVESPAYTVASGATTGPIATVRTATAAVVNFRVTKMIFTKGSGPAAPYFDGATSSSHTALYSWAGAPYASESAQTVAVPDLWSSTVGAVSFDQSVKAEGSGSVKVTLAAPSTAVPATYSLATPLPANKKITIIALAQATNLTSVTLTAYNGTTALGAVTSSLSLDAPWIEARLKITPTSTVTSIRITANLSASAAAGSGVWFTELTATVDDTQYWQGTPFHGDLDGMGNTLAWLGAPHQSKTSLLSDVSSSPKDDTKPGSLFHPAALSTGMVSEFLWTMGSVKSAMGNSAFVFLHGWRNRAKYNDNQPWNFQRTGNVYIAEVDMDTSVTTRFVHWMSDAKIRWGDDTVVDGGYYYVFGSAVNATNNGQMYVFRTPTADLITGTREYWNGSTWAAGNTPTPLLTLDYNGGLTGIRKYGDKWIGVYMAGLMSTIQGWEAPAATGPWTSVGTVYTAPTTVSYSWKYSPRFHPQFDSDVEGIAFSHCENGPFYGIRMLRGPKGTPVPQFDANQWSGRRFVDNSPDWRGGLQPFQWYGVRVRTRDTSSHVSDWAYSTPIQLAGDAVAPPKPAKPIVTPFFRGARIEVTGLSSTGAAMPVDFDKFTVHMSTDSSFAPGNSNLIDTLTTRGGITPVSDLTWGTAYYVKVVAWDNAGNYSTPSDPASVTPDRLSDADLPSKIIDGAKHIKDASLSVKNFTVGALGNSIVPNGDMEEFDATTGRPAGWKPLWWTGAGATFSSEKATPIAGAASLRIDVPAVSSQQAMSSLFPLTPGDIYYVSVKIRTSRVLVSNLISVQLAMGNIVADVNDWSRPNSIDVTVGTTDGGPQIVTIEGQVEVPDVNADGSGVPMRFGAVTVRPYHDDVEPYTAWIDSVEVRKVVGEAAIANASINRAKIRYLAVDDARISSVSVGKLVAGELWADVTVSARVMTSKTGQRVEMNRDGLFGYNSAGDAVTEVRASDGGLVSRWVRTNTTGTRIELGTFSTGGDAALMAFFPDANSWPLAPVVGFGDSRTPSLGSLGVEGMIIQSGSSSTAFTNQYGVSNISIDQVNGIVVVTGCKFPGGTDPTTGSKVVIGANGASPAAAYMQLYVGPTITTAKAAVYLHQTWGSSHIDVNGGNIYWATYGDYNYATRLISFAFGGLPANHMEFRNPYGYRFSNGLVDWLRISDAGVIQGSGAFSEPKIHTRSGNASDWISFDNAGNAFVNGSSTAVKTFVIDHPAKEDHYLVHATVEGPEARVVYEGRCVTDSAGHGTIILPDYFEALTVPGTEVVHLTPMLRGSAIPQVAYEKISGRRLEIRCSVSKAEISYSVTAQRRGTDFDVEPPKTVGPIRRVGPYTYLEKGEK